MEKFFLGKLIVRLLKKLQLGRGRVKENSDIVGMSSLYSTEPQSDAVTALQKQRRIMERIIKEKKAWWRRTDPCNAYQ